MVRVLRPSTHALCIDFIKVKAASIESRSLALLEADVGRFLRKNDGHRNRRGLALVRQPEQ